MRSAVTALATLAAAIGAAAEANPRADTTLPLIAIAISVAAFGLAAAAYIGSRRAIRIANPQLEAEAIKGERLLGELGRDA